MGTNSTRWARLGWILGWVHWAAVAAPVDFSREVLPILSDHCFHCHGPSDTGRKAGLRLDLREEAVKERKGRAALVPGKPEASELVRRLDLQDPDEVMPPPETHKPLSKQQKDTLRRWVAEGAPWGKHWAFEPVGNPSVPQPKEKGWGHNDLDRFVLARMETAGLHPSRSAAPAELARRVALDLTGLPPSETEVRALQSDPSPAAYDAYVDRLLASPAHGEHMAREWLDLARYADTYGFQSDVERDMSPWRDWVVRSINANLPYDQFLTWQLAGDLLPGATQEQVLATAFNRLHRQTNEGGSIEDEWRQEYVSDRVHTVGTAMLGLSLECSRCHDHKYDPISQRDYYSIAAFFNSIDESGLYSHFTTATPTPTMFLYREGEQRRHDELLRAVTGASERLAAALQASAIPAPPPVPRSPAPLASYTFEKAEGGKSPNGVSTNGAAEGAVRLVDDRGGKVLEFNGDDSVSLPGIGRFGRNDPFSIGLWLKPAEARPRAVVLHVSQAWTDSGSRGYELVLDAGRPFFGLIHFWPGNALAVRGLDKLPVGEWSHVTVTYDGSSKASGIALYVNGRPAKAEVVRDHLYKDIRHRGEWGDSAAGSLSLTLGARFRDNGFRNGRIDDLVVHGVALTPWEVRASAGDTAPATSAELRAWHAHRADPAVAAAREATAKARAAEDAFVTGLKEMMVMREMDRPRPTHVLARGAYDAPGALVERGVPERIFPMPADLPRNRLGLARWLTDPRHPLTSRVAVNRAWKLHFGRGLVSTVEDFGNQGRAPTHPELLDWLCRRFMDSGWDRKALHRLIVTSATYRQASSGDAASRAKDPENVWLARGPRHRLPAEVLRDRALAASGLLVGKIGGRSVKPYQPAGVWEDAGTGKSYSQDHGEALYRRSVYTFWRRTAPPPSMLTFDAPSREVCTAKREATATPLQALVLLNDPQFLEAARVLAQAAWRTPSPQGDAPRLAQVFHRVLGRDASPLEVEVLQQLLAQQRAVFAAKPESAQQYLKVGEIPPDASIPPAELAAATVVVSTLMNHDEFVMKR
ncbi:MAG: DUF1553 domain-containing protein [Verrucomicrobiota bacterium]